MNSTSGKPTKREVFLGPGGGALDGGPQRSELRPVIAEQFPLTGNDRRISNDQWLDRKALCDKVIESSLNVFRQPHRVR